MASSRPSMALVTTLFLLFLGGSVCTPSLPNASASASTESAPCAVFCNGSILEAVQLGGLFNDSKTFVDRPLLVSPETAVAAFKAAFPSPLNASREALAAFVEEYFDSVGSDLLNCTPPDYRPTPPRITHNVQANASLQFALDINAIWPQLCRKATPDVAAAPDRHTLLATPHPMIVPGGRFRESYYWDSYWIVRGLLVSGMRTSACGVVLNLLSAAEEYGFVPNGFRSYYLTRSQPPLLSEMVLALLNDDGTGSVGDGARGRAVAQGEEGGSSNDPPGEDVCGFPSREAFLDRWLPAMDQEYAFWMANRSVSVTNNDGDGIDSSTPAPVFLLNLYNATTELPRPESYLEDVTNGKVAASSAAAQGKDPDAAARAYYHGAATAAETGWDFTARWFRDGKNLTTMGEAMPNIVEVELNTYMLRYELNLASFHATLANSDRVVVGTGAGPTARRSAASQETAAEAAAAAAAAAAEAEATRYAMAALDRAAAMDAMMWNETAQRWHDLFFDWNAITHAGGTTIDAGSSRPGVGSTPRRARQLLRSFNSSSSFLPLLAGAASTHVPSRVARAAQALIDGDLWLSGGVVSTTANGTDQQWDSPNAWSPVQHMLIEGLLRVSNETFDGSFAEAAKDLATRWLRSNYQAFQNLGGKMFEKYNALRPGFPGGGGEYQSAQLGFGWTNGVALALLDAFGDIDVAAGAGR